MCLLVFYQANTQIITTYAGTGNMGYSGDGGLAAQAQMRLPIGLAYDKAGNLYVSDDANNVIRKIDAVTRVITTVVGGGTNYGNCALKDAALLGPHGIAFDKYDNLYIASGSTYIRKVDFAAQTITTIAGTFGVTDDFVGLGDGGPAVDAHFDSIYGMAIDADGNLYLADMLNFRIRRIDAKTQIVTTFAGEARENSIPTVEMSLNQVLDVAVDKEGNVYIPDQGTIRKVDIVTHEVTTLAGQFRHEGYSGDGGLAVNATLSPLGVAVDNDHNVFITDWGNQRIRKIDSKTGIISTIAGNGTEGYAGDCDPSQQSILAWPWAIIINNNGEVFFTEMHNQTVRKISNGKPNIIFGAGTLCLHDSILLTNEATGGLWVSSNTTVAVVDNSGLVKSLDTGIANITYTTTAEGCNVITSTHIIQVKAVNEAGAISSLQQACIGSPVLLTGFTDNGTWLSSDSLVAFITSSGYINSQRSGTVLVKHLVQEQCAITGKITVQVVQPQRLFIGNDTSFCSNQTLVINAGNNVSGYLWNTGAVSPSIKVSVPGIYSVSATDINQCRVTDSLIVRDVFDTSAISWPRVSSLCKGASLLLSAPAGAVSVQWQDFSSGNTFTVTKPGLYWIKAINNHQCISSDTLVIDKEIALPTHFLPADTIFCSYDKFQITSAMPFASYRWSTGSIASFITIEDSGIYSLQATDQYGCTSTDSIAVKEKTCYNNIRFPNAFTPNGDGNNDVFRPKVYGSLQQFTMTIYNRWGKKIFETHNWQQGWDGKAGSVFLEDGTYIWQAVYLLPNDSPRKEKGVVVMVK